MWFSIYDPATGRFTGARLELCTQGLEADEIAQCLAAHLPEGLAALEGEHDAATRIVVDGQAEPCEPPAEDEARAFALQRAARVMHVVARIDAIEATQARPLRELSLAAAAGLAAPAAALERIRQADADIAALRAVVQALGAAQNTAELQAVQTPEPTPDADGVIS